MQYPATWVVYINYQGTNSLPVTRMLITKYKYQKKKLYKMTITHQDLLPGEISP